MNLSPVEIAAMVAAGCMAASKFITAGKDLWNKLPHVVAVAAPAVVVCLPKIADMFGMVHTTGSLITTGVAAVALLVHGVSVAEKQA